MSTPRIGKAGWLDLVATILLKADRLAAAPARPSGVSGRMSPTLATVVVTTTEHGHAGAAS